MASTENYCLRWNDFRTNLIGEFQDLRSCNELFDITLTTDAGEVKAHKMVLSACSPYFREVLTRSSNLTQTNLIIYLRGVKQSDLEYVVEYMYSGEVQVPQEDLNSFLSVAEDLRVRGLAGGDSGRKSSRQREAPTSLQKPTRAVPDTPPQKRAKVRMSSPPRRKKDDALPVNLNQDESTEVIFSPDCLGTEIVIEPSEMEKKVDPELNDIITRIDDYLRMRVVINVAAGVECEICERVCRDSFDAKKHYLTHFLSSTSAKYDADLGEKIDSYVSANSEELPENKFLCYVCRSIVSGNRSKLRTHFVTKHLHARKTF